MTAADQPASYPENAPMRLAILGATGGIGGHVLNWAARAGQADPAAHLRQAVRRRAGHGGGDPGRPPGLDAGPAGPASPAVCW